MSCFLEILKCVLCCEHDSYEDTYSRRRPFLESHSSSSYERYTDVVYQSPPRTTTPLYHDNYQTFPNSSPSASSSNLTKAAVDAWLKSSVTIKPQHVQSSVKITFNDVSHSSKSSSLLPPTTFPSRPLQSSSKPPIASSISFPKIPKSPPASSSASYKPLQSSPYVVLPSSSSSTKQPPDFKPILHPGPFNVINEGRKTSYVSEKGTAIYAIPEDFKDQIKKDIAPKVLTQQLSPSTYKAYFAALLYAEDYHLEKWSDYLLEKVTLELHEAAIYKKSNKYNDLNGSVEKDDKIFVAFEIDSVPERRPFLLSRDMVHARPSGKKVEPFQHRPNHKYDISFSFNRVCLKRAHQAVEAVLNPMFQNFLFPPCVSRKNIINPPDLLYAYHKLNTDEFNSVRRILSFRGSPPYLLEGPPIVIEVKRSIPKLKALSTTGVVVREAIFEIYRTSAESRILICAPINSTSDVLKRSLMKVIPESDVFRANAAFREIDGVPVDILRSCPVKGECFVCPSLEELRKFRIILSTYVSSFRLFNEGITAGHFSHIFLMDASSTTEPEAMIALSNFAKEDTTVIATGSPKNHSGWVRSSMARKNGLRKSYFERLHERQPYQICIPMFITELVNFERHSDDTYGYSIRADTMHLDTC
ncbi:probable RNA helicase SDE3 [Fagus crenata]